MWKNRWTSIFNKIEVVSNAESERALLRSLVEHTSPRVLAFVNAHAMNSCVQNVSFFEALSGSDILLRDGSGMAALYQQVDKYPGLNMNGTDFIPKILTAFHGRSVAFWGTNEPFLSKALQKSELTFGVKVTSCVHGFLDFNHYLRLEQETAPDLIVLGMGMPKQEQLAQAIRAQTSGTPLIVCGGAILDFLGGKIERAPRIMRRAGLEWLYRFALEPRRLFLRYIIGNPVFLLRCLLWSRR